MQKLIRDKVQSDLIIAETLSRDGRRTVPTISDQIGSRALGKVRVIYILRSTDLTNLVFSHWGILSPVKQPGKTIQEALR